MVRLIVRYGVCGRFRVYDHALQANDVRMDLVLQPIRLATEGRLLSANDRWRRDYPFQAQPGGLWHCLLRAMQESPQAFPTVQILQHRRAGAGAGGDVGSRMTGAERVMGVAVGRRVATDQTGSGVLAPAGMIRTCPTSMRSTSVMLLASARAPRETA